MSFKEVRVDLVDRERFEYFSKWYFSTIRKLLFIYDFRRDFENLARTLRPAIKPSQA